MENNQNESFRFLIRLFRRWNDFRAWFANSLDADDERKSTLYIDLSRSATLKDIVYWLQLLFSAGIATMGLVQNSSAVIIGAMLISPLMAPILSGGLALATGDLTLGVRAFVNLFLSSMLGLGFAFVLVKLLPFQDLTSEISAKNDTKYPGSGDRLVLGCDWRRRYMQGNERGRNFDSWCCYCCCTDAPALCHWIWTCTWR